MMFTWHCISQSYHLLLGVSCILLYDDDVNDCLYMFLWNITLYPMMISQANMRLDWTIIVLGAVLITLWRYFCEMTAAKWQPNNTTIRRWTIPQHLNHSSWCCLWNIFRHKMSQGKGRSITVCIENVMLCLQDSLYSCTRFWRMVANFSCVIQYLLALGQSPVCQRHWTNSADEANTKKPWGMYCITTT